VLGRFGSALGTTINATLAEALARATRTETDVVSLCSGNPFVIEGLQALLDAGNEGGARSYPLERIARDPRVRGKWRIPFDAYAYLCEVLGVKVADPVEP
jgi:hypothetical protein